MTGIIDWQADTKTRLWLVLPGTDMQIWKGQGKGCELQGGAEAPRNCSWGSVLQQCQVTKNGAHRGLLSLDRACQEEPACQGQGCHAEASCFQSLKKILK